MKKLLSIAVVLLLGMSVHAQKLAYIDTDYILGKVPAYQAAQKQLDELAAKWQQRIEQAVGEIDQARKQFQSEEALYSDEMKKRKQDELVAKERAVQDLQKKYFGTQGELYKKRQELIAPIQEDLYNAVKSVAEEGSYAIVLDKASGLNIIYAQPRYDISNDVLQLMGN